MTSAEDRYRTLLDASSTLADQPTVKAVLHSLRDVLSSTSRLHGTELWVLNDEHDSLRVLEFDRDPDAPAFKIGTTVSRIGAAARVLEEQKPVFIPDSSQEMLKHPELAPFAAECVGRTAYLFPVSTAQKRYGVLSVTKLQSEKFAPEDVEMLRSLASHVAIALECALARDRGEQLRSKLQRSEAYLTEAQRLSHTGSFGWSVASGELSWSGETFRIFECDPKVKPTLDLVLQRTHPDDRALVQQTLDRASNDGTTFDCEHRLLMPDRRVKHLHVVADALQDSSGAIEFVGAVMDITAAKRAEQDLQRSEAYLAEAQRLSHTGSFAYNPGSGKTLYWSEELFRIFGLDPQRGIPDFEETYRLLHPDDRDRVSETCLQGFGEKAEFSQDYRLLLHDGTVKHLYVMWHPVLDKDGELVEYVGTAADVTERKQAEDALRRSEAYLADAQSLTHTGAYAMNGTSREPTYYSAEMFRLFGFDPKEGLPTREQVWQRIHPEDRDKVKEGSDRTFLEKVASDFEYRIVLSDGTVRHVHTIGHPVLGANGEVVEAAATMVDITERKRAEERLRQDEMELRQIIDVVPQHIFVLEPEGRFLYANRRDLEYTGLRLEDVLAPDYLRRLWHPDDLKRLLHEREHAIAQGVPWESEVRLLGKDGQYRWFLIRLNPLRDEQGRVLRWYGTRTDIEDRKQAEDGLQTALDEVKKLKDRLYRENVALRDEIDKTSMFEEIVGTSAVLQKVLSRVSKVAPTDSTVLVTGETGTGKELVARAIHRRSHRSSCAFVSVNCAAIPRDLIASELFGHEKGAFTGATQRHMGRFELAEGGTIFLDEVGDLPAETQIALLRVLQEHEFERVGGIRSIQTNVRVIAATNRDLRAATEAGTFRDDLFYRLNVFPIEIPPLRERREDIPLLVEYFINRFAKRAGKSIRGLNKKTLDLFQSYPWPGNIRELQNVIERSVIVCETEIFSLDESWLSRQPPSAAPRNSVDLVEKLTAQEKEMIEAALRECGGRVFGPSGAAARLGMPRSTLESKIKALKINKNRFKSEVSSSAS